ncbi:MAG: DUF1761 family protein [Ekhidna sp.]
MQKLSIRPSSIILASIFLSTFGGIWYGLLFRDVQISAHRYTAEEYANDNPIWYIGGVLISLLIAWGISLIIRLKGEPGIRAGISASLKAVIGFGLPLVSYPLVFSPLHDLQLYAVGLSQIIIGWTVAGAIVGGMIKK